MNSWSARTGDGTAVVHVIEHNGAREVTVVGNSGHTTVLPDTNHLTDQVAATVKNARGSR